MGLRQAMLQRCTGLERGKACLFLTVCCDFCDGVSQPLPPSLSSTEFPLWTIAMQGSEVTAAFRGGIFQYLMANVAHLEALDLERNPDTEIPMGSHNSTPSYVSMAPDSVQLSIKKKEKNPLFREKCFSTSFFQAFAYIFCTIEPDYSAVWKG